MTARSARREVRNPVLALPAVREIAGEQRGRDLARILRAIRSDAQRRADKCWRTHKAPMAAYWKAVAVYAGHLARALETTK